MKRVPVVATAMEAWYAMVYVRPAVLVGVPTSLPEPAVSPVPGVREILAPPLVMIAAMAKLAPVVLIELPVVPLITVDLQLASAAKFAAVGVTTVAVQNQRVAVASLATDAAVTICIAVPEVKLVVPCTVTALETI